MSQEASERLEVETIAHCHRFRLSSLVLYGVGPKGRSLCIALFSLDQHHVIPVDTHVWQFVADGVFFDELNEGLIDLFGASRPDALLNGLEIFKLGQRGDLSYPSKPLGSGGNASGVKEQALWVGIGSGITSIVLLAFLCTHVFILCGQREKQLLPKTIHGWLFFSPLREHGITIDIAL
ncbi:hypothetical protein IFM89_001032 [Coptis chinensis]|uniref:Uncharacterized protein n=1 Tax=Coptis chinensis TaxID=261450 RepID=A0A835GY23_9MAGN|nr:hypothetical protein IFM89_001032 [Coptis chinensis]